MLNIENYDQWAKVCDDDELILDLYNSGIRPGTDEFRKLLGEPYRGKPADSTGIAVLVSGVGLIVLSIWGSVKLIKFTSRKVKQFVSTQHNKREEES